MPQHRFIAAVDIGATNIRVAIANADGEVEARRVTPFPGGTPEQVIERIGRTIDELARGVWVGAAAAAIGVVVPGSVDPESGVVSTAANLQGWGDVPIEALLGGPRGVPVAMENDANAAAVGERWLGAAKGLERLRVHRARHGHRRRHLRRRQAPPRRPLSRRRSRLLPDDAASSFGSRVGSTASRATSAAVRCRRRPPNCSASTRRSANLFDAAASGDERAAAWLAAGAGRTGDGGREHRRAP